MNICYLCGQTMVTEECYKAHPEEFADEPRFNHNEHIIQNALFGRLKPSTILCKQCGNEFSLDTDANFVSLFRIITDTVHDTLITKDHGKMGANTLKGYLVLPDEPGKQIAIHLKDGVVTPQEPFYRFQADAASRNVVTLYGNAARLKQYKKVVEKELKGKGIDTAELIWQTVTDMSDLVEKGEFSIHFTEGIEDFNKRFRAGMVKIAVGFATYCGIARKQMSKALRIDANGKGQLIPTQNMITFVPIGTLDMQLELNRPLLERHYPSHTLILFSQEFSNGRKSLYCYIDLFSTFQYYILLDDKYIGDDIYQTYHQALAKEAMEKVDVRRVRFKHLNILASMYQIDMKRFKNSGYADVYDFMQAEVDKYTFKPHLNLTEEVFDMLERLQHSFAVSKMDQALKTPLIKELGKMNDSMSVTFLAELRSYFSGQTKDITTYRRTFIENGGDGGEEWLSTPQECLSPTITDDYRRSYCTLKFEHLSFWIFQNIRLAAALWRT